MIVDAAVWIWAKDGMRRISEVTSFALSTGTRYIEVAEAERLLEEAHRRGYESAQARAPGPKDLYDSLVSGT